MQSLKIEKTYQVLLGGVNTFRIMLVGVGGTGSALAPALAGLAYHARQKGIQVKLTLVDHGWAGHCSLAREVRSGHSLRVVQPQHQRAFTSAPDHRLCGQPHRPAGNSEDR